MCVDFKASFSLQGWWQQTGLCSTPSLTVNTSHPAEGIVRLVKMNIADLAIKYTNHHGSFLITVVFVLIMVQSWDTLVAWTRFKMVSLIIKW